MKKWEYLIERIELKEISVEEILASKGEEGWELVQYEVTQEFVYPTDATLSTFQIKRAVQMLSATFKREKE